jgi:hypothetical protein
MQMDAGTTLDAGLSVVNLSLLRATPSAEPSVKTQSFAMANMSMISAKGATVAGGTTTSVFAATDGDVVDISGSGWTCTSFGTAQQAGHIVEGTFQGTGTLTQSANLNINGGGSNISVEAGDHYRAVANTTSQIDVFVTKKSGKAVTPPGGIQQFSANGTFTVPAGITTIYVTACAGGGGGAGGASSSSCGGGGGGAGDFVFKSPYTVTPGASISITIGAAGTAGPANSAGGAGGNTVIGSLVTLTGGTGGFAPGNSAIPGAGGGGNTGGQGGSIVIVSFGSSASFGTGGTGGACFLGLAGRGGSCTPAGTAQSGSTGAGFGAGGGGGGSSSSGGAVGGAGRPGYVIIEW